MKCRKLKGHKMGKGYRQGRLGEEIRKIISELLMRELKDPRLDVMVSVTAVEATSYGSYATCYLSIFDNGADEAKLSEKQEECIRAMENAKGFIKRSIGKQITLKHMPELIFKIDSSMEYGRHMDELLSKVIKNQDEK